MIELGLKVTLAYLLGAVLGSLARRLLLRRRRHPQGRQRQRRRHQRAAHAGQGVRALGHGHRHRQGHPRRRRDSAARDSRRRHRSVGRPLARALRASRSPRSWATCFRCGSGSAAARAERRPRGSSAISRPAAALPVIGSWLLIVFTTGFVGLATISASLVAVIVPRLHAPCRSRAACSCSRAARRRS